MKNLTILTLNEPHITDYAAARNKLLRGVKTDWALFLDSDEQITPELENEIKDAISSGAYQAYQIPRQDLFLGRTLRHGETGDAAFTRLARVGWGSWERPVHEQWLGLTPVGRLTNPIIHTPHPDLSSFLAKIDKYSSLEADYRFDRHVNSSLWHILVFPVGKFCKNYFYKLGILDGVPGTIHAFFMSFHSYLTWSKLYLLCKKS